MTNHRPALGSALVDERGQGFDSTFSALISVHGLRALAFDWPRGAVWRPIPPCRR